MSIKHSYMNVQCHFVTAQTGRFPNVHLLMNGKTTTTTTVVYAHKEILLSIKRREQWIQATIWVHHKNTE